MATDPPVSSTAAAPPGEIAKTMAGLAGELLRLNKAGADTSKIMPKLDQAFARLSKQENTTKKATSILTDQIQLLAKGSSAAAAAAEGLADEYARSMDIMSTAQKKSLEKRIEDLKVAEETARSQGKAGEKNADILGAKRSQMQQEILKDSLRSEKLRAIGMQNSGKLIRGAFNGVWASAKLAKTELVGKVGGALGMTGQSMAKMAGPAVILTGVFLALNGILKGASRHAKEASEAGFDIGESLDSAVKAGDNFSQAMYMAASASGMSRDQILGLTKSFSGEMGLSITSSANDAVQLATQLGGVGVSFGMAADEGVKLGVKMGVLSRAGIGGTRIAFQNLGEQAGSLNVNMEVLADPMTQLAEVSGIAGAGVMDSVGGFNAIVGAAKGLTNLKGPLNTMFESMRGADKAAAVKRFTSNFSKIDDIQWAAFSMGKGENFFDAVGRLTSAGGGSVKAKLGYLDNLSEKLGIDKMDSKVQQQYTMGSVLSKGALAGNFAGARELGAMALATRKSGTAFDETAATAGIIDARFQRRESVGQYVAGGGDIMQLIAHKLENILDVLTGFASGVTKMLRFLPGMPSNASAGVSSNYGSAGAGTRRTAGPVNNSVKVK